MLTIAAYPATPQERRACHQQAHVAHPPLCSHFQVVVWDGCRQSVIGEYPNEMEALVASELMSPALPPVAGLQSGGGMHAFTTSDPRGPSIQEVWGGGEGGQPGREGRAAVGLQSH